MLEIFINVFGPAIALGIDSGVRLAGREPGEDEIEPLSRALLERARETPSIAYMGAVAQLQALARGLVAFFADYDVLVTPALGERPLPIGECNGLGDDPLADLARSGTFTPYTSLFNITGQPAISLPVGFGTDGLPTGVQIVGKPLNEDTAAAARGADRERRTRGRTTARPRTSAIRRGVTPSASAPAVPRRAEHLHREQLRLVPGDERRGAGERLLGPQRGAQAGERERQRAPAAAARRRSTSRTTSRWVSVSGPASS